LAKWDSWGGFTKKETGKKNLRGEEGRQAKGELEGKNLPWGWMKGSVMFWATWGPKEEKFTT